MREVITTDARGHRTREWWDGDELAGWEELDPPAARRRPGRFTAPQPRQPTRFPTPWPRAW